MTRPKILDKLLTVIGPQLLHKPVTYFFTARQICLLLLLLFSVICYGSSDFNYSYKSSSIMASDCQFQGTAL